MTSPDGALGSQQYKELVYTETVGKGGDKDPGNNENWTVYYGGSEGPDSRDLDTPAAGEVPYTYEEANPQLQYTRPDPQLTPVPTQGQMAPTAITRSILLVVPATGPANEPVMVLGKNPRRIRVQVTMTTVTTAQLWVGNDPAGVGAGQGMPVQAGTWQEWLSYGELYVSITGVAGTGTAILSVVEYQSI